MEEDGNSVARLNPYGLPWNNIALAISGDVMQNVLLSVEYVIAVIFVFGLVWFGLRCDWQRGQLTKRVEFVHIFSLNR